MNSKGVTPTNQNHPALISTSNLLQGSGGTGAFNNFVTSQAQMNMAQASQSKANQLQQKLLAGTPRLQLGSIGVNNRNNQNSSTNAAAANAFLAQSGDKNNVLNSNQTFNGGAMFGSKLNTKTNA